jgi:hypothetical protein
MLTNIPISQELIDDAGGFEVPSEMFWHLIALEDWRMLYPNRPYVKVVARPGLRAWLYRLLFQRTGNEDHEYEGYFHELTPEFIEHREALKQKAREKKP